MKTYVVVLASLFVFFTNAIFAQEHNWRVTLVDGKKFSKVALGEISADSLTLIQHEQSQRIPIASINEIRRLRPSRFLAGFGIGFLVGAGSVILTPEKSTPVDSSNSPWAVDIEIFSKEAGAISFGLIAGLAGGLVGSAVSADRVYDVSGISPWMKEMKIRKILLQHKPKQSP